MSWCRKPGMKNSNLKKHTFVYWITEGFLCHRHGSKTRILYSIDKWLFLLFLHRHGPKHFFKIGKSEYFTTVSFPFPLWSQLPQCQPKIFDPHALLYLARRSTVMVKQGQGCGVWGKKYSRRKIHNGMGSVIIFFPAYQGSAWAPNNVPMPKAKATFGKKNRRRCLVVLFITNSELVRFTWNF